jgi:hypothetical protein
MVTAKSSVATGLEVFLTSTIGLPREIGFGETRGGDDRVSAHDGQQPGAVPASPVLPPTAPCPASVASASNPTLPNPSFLHDSRIDALAYAGVWNVPVRSCAAVPHQSRQLRPSRQTAPTPARPLRADRSHGPARLAPGNGGHPRAGRHAAAPSAWCLRPRRGFLARRW